VTYRIQYFRGDIKIGDIASDKSLAETLENAIDLMDLFAADYALIVDADGQLVDRVKRSTQPHQS
jgi:hypothetical protein